MSFEESYFDSQEEQEIFPLSILSRVAIRVTISRIQLVPGALYLEVNQSGRETGHSTSSSAEERSEYSHISSLPYISVMHSQTFNNTNTVHIFASYKPLQFIQYNRSLCNVCLPTLRP